MNKNIQGIVLKDIISQYAEEAAFLWVLRDRAVHAPHYRVGDLSALDRRIEAHLDGLSTAGRTGWDVCMDALAWMEAGEIFTTAVLAFEESDQKKIEIVLEAGVTSSELIRGIVSALGWLPYSRAERNIKNLLSAGDPGLKRIGIAASAINRQDPGLYLSEALSCDDVCLRMEALRAVGLLGRADMLFCLKQREDFNHEGCRFWAAWSGALFGDNDSIEVLKSIAASDGPYMERAMKMAAISMDMQSIRRWHEELTGLPVSDRLLIICAGLSGDVSFIPWLMENMGCDELARIAGESLSMITGIDIADGSFAGKKPESFEAGPIDESEDENVEPDPDEHLPWPDCQAILDWWSKNRDLFSRDTRYLLGQPLSPAWLGQVLRFGRQRERGVAAIMLATLHRGTPLFEIRAPGFRQEHMLHQKLNI